MPKPRHFAYTLLPALAVATCLLSSSAQGVETARRMIQVGTGNGVVLTDGGRFAAYQDGTDIVLLDGQGSRLRHRSVDLAGPCASMGGELQAAGAGLFAIRCLTSSPMQQRTRRLMIYDPFDGTFTPSAGLDQMDGDFESITGVGDIWISVQATARGSVRNLLLNWRTGQRIPTPMSRVRILDLSSASGTSAVCRGLSGFVSSQGFAYQHRRAIYQRRTSSRRTLYLKSCDGKAQRLATRQSGSFKSQLTDRYVSWAEQSSIVVRRLSSRRQAKWRAPGRRMVSVGLVGRHDVVGVANSTRGVRVYSGEVPTLG